MDPNASAYVSIGQATHSVDPAVATYVPAEQVMQIDASVAPTAVEYVPFEQGIHSYKPAVFAYFPAGHVVQIDTSVSAVQTSHVDVTLSFL